MPVTTNVAFLHLAAKHLVSAELSLNGYDATVCDTIPRDVVAINGHGDAVTIKVLAARTDDPGKIGYIRREKFDYLAIVLIDEKGGRVVFFVSRAVADDAFGNAATRLMLVRDVPLAFAANKGRIVLAG
jgi:hypothetical protein